VNDEVELSLPGGEWLSVTVTSESTEALALQLQQRVIALVKASSVVLATPGSETPSCRCATGWKAMCVRSRWAR